MCFGFSYEKLIEVFTPCGAPTQIYENIPDITYVDIYFYFLFIYFVNAVKVCSRSKLARL